jgi:hypothetical protein
MRAFHQRHDRAPMGLDPLGSTIAALLAGGHLRGEDFNLAFCVFDGIKQLADKLEQVRLAFKRVEFQRLVIGQDLMPRSSGPQ